MTAWLLGILLTAALAALCILLVRTRASLDRMDDMLDRAFRGELEPAAYDESRLSRLEEKLGRVLGAASLRRGQVEAERAGIQTLISDISHQVKTPLANMLLYAQLLEEQMTPDSEESRLAGQIVAGADKLSFLVQALVKASRLESGIIRVSPVRWDAGGLAEEAVMQCRPAAAEKGLALELDRPEEAIHVMADPKWCVEALYNILDNAVKYTDTGSICVSIQGYELFVRIDVADTGRGIAPEDQALVFGRFWRSPSSDREQGVGIGLYLSREIISACGGYITVSSRLGEGSMFSVFLPRGSGSCQQNGENEYGEEN